jgi:hypothetical protein
MAGQLRAELLQHCFQAAHAIQDECQFNQAADQVDLKQATTNLGLQQVDNEILQSLGGYAARVVLLHQRSVGFMVNSIDVSGQSGSPANFVDHTGLENGLDELISRVYKKFYDYVFKDLPQHWRQLYTDASIVKFHLLVITACLENCTTTQRAGSEIIDSMVHTLDRALIIAGGAGKQRGKKWIEKALSLLEKAVDAPSDFLDSNLERCPLTRSFAKRKAVVQTTDAKKLKLNGEYRDDLVGQANEANSVTASVGNRDADTLTDSCLGDVEFPDDNWDWDLVSRPNIPRHDRLSVDQFQEYLDRKDFEIAGTKPLLFTKMMEDWPALTTNPWRKPAYLLSRTFNGRRLVPVEVGRTYVDAGWTQSLIPFRDLIKELMDPPDCTTPATQTGTAISDEKSTDITLGGDLGIELEQAALPVNFRSYLAQHELFSQLPILRNDIPTPDLCWTTVPPHPISATQNEPPLPVPLANAWFGPAGTITPLHTDSYHNLLCQVVGRKYVRLYPPQETEQLFPRGREGSIDMANTSAVDVGVVEGWDIDTGSNEVTGEQIEKFRGAEYVDCVLAPGETLYIPIGWWHYVRSLSVSFSVSFWWN